MENMLDIKAIFTGLVEFLPRMGAAILVFLSFLLLSRFLRAGVQRFGRTRRLSQDVVSMLVQIGEVGLQMFGIVTALGTLGINVGAMIAGLGLVGFALGFALKDLLSNFLAGFLILIYNPFVRGDQIKVGEHEGDVIEINLRYTVLQGDDKRILIPNATLFSNAVIVQRRRPDQLPGADSGPINP
jgi:small-conductance mechanosensitive channel